MALTPHSPVLPFLSFLLTQGSGMHIIGNTSVRDNIIQKLDKKYWQHCCDTVMADSRAANFVDMNKDC